jgi:hypothetical protein
MNVSHATYRIQRAELFPSIAATGLEQTPACLTGRPGNACSRPTP